MVRFIINISAANNGSFFFVNALPTLPSSLLPSDYIRVDQERGGGIEKPVRRITDCHHKAFRVMTNGDRDGRIFLSHPYKNNSGFFFFLTTKYLILY